MESYTRLLTAMVPIVMAGIFFAIVGFGCSLGASVASATRMGNRTEVHVLSGNHFFSHNTDTTAVVVFVIMVIVLAALAWSAMMQRPKT